MTGNAWLLLAQTAVFAVGVLAGPSATPDLRFSAGEAGDGFGARIATDGDYNGDGVCNANDDLAAPAGGSSPDRLPATACGFRRASP